MSENKKEEKLLEGLCIICGKPVEITDGTDPDLSEVSHYLCEESAVIAHGGMSREELPEVHIQGSLPPKAEAALVGLLKAAYPRETQGGNSQPEEVPEACREGRYTEAFRLEGTESIPDYSLPHGYGRNPFAEELPPFEPGEGSHRILAGLQDPQDSDEGLSEDDPSIDHSPTWPLCPDHRSELSPAVNTRLYCTTAGCDHSEVFQGPDPDPDDIPVICFTKDIECQRCKGAGKIQNTNPRLLVTFIDCPDCAGEGKTQKYEPVSEASLDEGIALGMELAQLRKAKALAYEATTKILGILHLAHNLAKETPHIQAEAAAKNIKEAVKVTGELQRELLSAEYPKPDKPHPEDAAIKQAQDLAQKGYAAVYGTPLGQGVYMVDENTVTEWRKELSRAITNLKSFKNDIQASERNELSTGILLAENVLDGLPGGDQ